MPEKFALPLLKIFAVVPAPTSNPPNAVITPVVLTLPFEYIVAAVPTFNAVAASDVIVVTPV